MGNAPVDIAGFMKNSDVVKTFCKDLEKKILIENKVRMQSGEGDQELLADNEGAPTATKLSQVQPDNLTTSGMVSNGR